jgi:dipeptidyl aminopeptidase/acylaminoacyl peptidase
MGDDPDNYYRASPLQHVHAGAPPFLIIHGDGDVVPVDNGNQLTAALRATGASVRMLELGGAGHVHSAVTPTDAAYLQAATDTPEAWAVTFDFLAQTLGAP